MKSDREEGTEKYEIFVGGLEWKITNEDLLDYFSSFGTVLHCAIQSWGSGMRKNKCRGFAFLTVADQATFNSIVSSFHRIGSRWIECKPKLSEAGVLNLQKLDSLDRKIFVRGLRKSMNENALKCYFEQFGGVELAYIIKNHKNCKSRGFGFVTFKNKEDKDRVLAIKELKIDGRAIQCFSYCSRPQQETEEDDTFSCDADHEDLRGHPSNHDELEHEPANEQLQARCLALPLKMYSEAGASRKSSTSKGHFSEVETVQYHPLQASGDLETNEAFNIDHNASYRIDSFQRQGITSHVQNHAIGAYQARTVATGSEAKQPRGLRYFNVFRGGDVTKSSVYRWFYYLH